MRDLLLKISLAVTLGGIDLAAFLNLLSVPSAHASAKNQSRLSRVPKTPLLQRLFRLGTEAYTLKAYEDSADLLTQLLQKQPDFLPAKIELARALYQLKRFTEAYKLFEQVDDISLLEPDPSYEYGQAAMRANNNTSALRAFRNVPNGHPMFDLAGYYGGIAAFKLADYQGAADLFGQAVVLPSKLLKSQKLYQKEAERLITQKQKQDLSNVQLPTPQQHSSPIAETPIEAKPLRRLQLARNVKLEPRVTTQAQETLSRLTSERLIKTGELELNFGLDHQGSSAKSSHLVLQNRLAAKALEGSSGLELIIPDVRSEQDQFIILRNPPQSLLSFEPTAAIEWPIGLSSSLGAIIGGRGVLPANKGAKGAFIPQLSFFLGQKTSGVETQLEANFYAMNYGDTWLFTNARQSGHINFQLPGRFHFILAGELSEFSYELDKINGPDWQGHLTSTLTYGNERGFKLSLGAFYELVEGQRLHDLPDAPIVQFSSSGSGFSLKSELTLVTNFNLGLEALATQRSAASLTPFNNSTRVAVEDVFSAFVTSFGIYVNYSLGF